MTKLEKRTVSRTGMCSMGWFLGHGYVRENLTVKSEVWCVVENNKVIAECRSKEHGEKIVNSLNSLSERMKTA